MRYSLQDMIHVIGHRNPDTDSIASAIGYAWLKREIDHVDAAAFRAGQVNTQSKFALDSFGASTPALLEDASPRFGAITLTPKVVTPETPLSYACQLYIDSEQPVPVVDAKGMAIGLVTGKGTFMYLMQHFDKADSATMREILDVPCIVSTDCDVPSFVSSDRIADQRDVLVRNRREFFLVVDQNGKYEGICKGIDLLQPPKMQLILVDHNEVNQAVIGLADAELLEVLDHHRIGTMSTTMPIAFHVDVVGSCSTLIAERMRLARITPPSSIAGMLLSGLLSDTLVFKSPTTTARDRACGSWLAWSAFNTDDAELQMQKYGDELLRAGADVTGRTATDMCSADFKQFEAGRMRFGVAQVEVTNYEEIEMRVDEIRDELRLQQQRLGLDFSALLITDVVKTNSLLVFGDDARLLGKIPFARKRPGVYDLPGVVSRKKQVLPPILALLNE